MNKVVFNILQRSAVTQTVLGGLTIYPPVANFLQCIGLCAQIGTRHTKPNVNHSARAWRGHNLHESTL